MARGWESKSVESQQDREVFTGSRRNSSREEIERSQRVESLQLSRRRVARELEAAKSEVHRAALQNALRHLDSEIAKTQS